MSSRVDAGAVRAFNAMFTIKELSLWIDQVTTAHAHTTHTDRNINVIRFSGSSYTLARPHMHYYP